jgi:hypothetical protein
MTRSGDEADWVTAWDSVQSVARAFGGLKRAQHALAIALREQLLTAAAEHTAICEGEDDFKELEAQEGEILEIPSDVWTRSEYWDSDRLAWDWEEGEFQIENSDLDCTYMFFGVHFLMSDLDKLKPDLPVFAELLTPGDTQTRIEQIKGARRGPKPSIRWAAFVQAILQLERDGDLMTAQYDGPVRLLDTIQERIDLEKQFDARTIEPVVSYIYANLLCGVAQK